MVQTCLFIVDFPRFTESIASSPGRFAPLHQRIIDECLQYTVSNTCRKFIKHNSHVRVTKLELDVTQQSQYTQMLYRDL